MNWSFDKNRAICPQLCQRLCARIVSGEFVPGQRLMSVREVALAAGVNPNTVQRAFEQLEQQGVLHSERGAGWFVSADITAARELHHALVSEKISEFFGEMEDLGMTAEDTKKIVEEWEA